MANSKFKLIKSIDKKNERKKQEKSTTIRREKHC